MNLQIRYSNKDYKNLCFRHAVSEALSPLEGIPGKDISVDLSEANESVCGVCKDELDLQEKFLKERNERQAAEKVAAEEPPQELIEK